jgi:GNAT superfamily N-acetyltransferase
MNIVSTTLLSAAQKEAVFQLWNNEYPAQIGYTDMTGFDNYLGNLANQSHHLYVDESNLIAGWAFSFEREEEKWFAIIVDSSLQRKGIGSTMLARLKEELSILNGWVVDHASYKRKNGEAYVTPLPFYTKNGFEVCTDIRLDIPQLSAVKIKWAL